jgi:hypothetical protein
VQFRLVRDEEQAPVMSDILEAGGAAAAIDNEAPASADLARESNRDSSAVGGSSAPHAMAMWGRSVDRSTELRSSLEELRLLQARTPRRQSGGSSAPRVVVDPNDVGVSFDTESASVQSAGVGIEYSTPPTATPPRCRHMLKVTSRGWPKIQANSRPVIGNSSQTAGPAYVILRRSCELQAAAAEQGGGRSITPAARTTGGRRPPPELPEGGAARVAMGDKESLLCPI